MCQGTWKNNASLSLSESGMDRRDAYYRFEYGGLWLALADSSDSSELNTPTKDQGQVELFIICMVSIAVTSQTAEPENVPSYSSHRVKELSNNDGGVHVTKSP
ncbi:hypothetical protein TEQG_08047 [Trichophyton equinum CBS 127.97]|uniref:Uncharacterized protein n=1 Tax=Trichophyton equinum (strain ATCC MYA-4606 / CBS 127.97) TaxID=559882 RepID=F2Q4P6_TRIEC|nr:hypothetical protein TEQG_08047 [Trichophyton equinum CBS 127.97]